MIALSYVIAIGAVASPATSMEACRTLPWGSR